MALQMFSAVLIQQVLSSAELAVDGIFAKHQVHSFNIEKCLLCFIL